MERRSFVKNTGILASTAMLFSTSDLIANTSTPDNVLDLRSVLSTGSNIAIKGLVVDAETHSPLVASVKMYTKRRRFMSKHRLMNSINGQYAVKFKMDAPDKLTEKIYFEIKAEGYKTFEGVLYVSDKGCNIHSEFWNYNPTFNPDFKPKNQKLETSLLSTFNFHLIKE